MNLAKLCAVGMTLLAVVAWASDIKINCGLKDDQVISGIYTVSVTCVSKSTITQVEFYLDGNLTFTDSSTPYEYKLDTVDQNEGPHSLNISAYAEDGTSAKTTVKFQIDNKLGLGPQAHVDDGNAALREQKYDDAMVAARIALKIKPNYAPALVVLGRADLGKGVYDESQNFIERAIEADPHDNFAQGMLAQVHLRKAFALGTAGLDPKTAASTEKDSLLAAVDAYRKYLQNKLKALGPLTDKNRNDYFDAQLQLGDTSSPREALSLFRETHRDDLDTANTLMYIHLRRGEFTDLAKVFDDVVRRKKADGTTYAFAAVAASIQGDNPKADEYIQKALKMERSNLQVKVCQAFITLDRGTPKALTTIAQDFDQNGYTAPEVQYYMGRIYFRLHDYDRSRAAYNNALLQNPMFSEVYTARGYEALSEARRIAGDPNRKDEKEKKTEVTRQLDAAKMYFDVALKAKPESAEALVGMGIALGYQPDAKAAAKFGEAALVVAPQVPWVCVAASGLTAMTSVNRGQDIMDKVRKDHPNMTFRSTIPTVMQAHDYVAKWGRTPVLIRP